jgi:hypothetical protein
LVRTFHFCNYFQLTLNILGSAAQMASLAGVNMHPLKSPEKIALIKCAAGGTNN